MTVVGVGGRPSAAPAATVRDFAVFDLDRTLLPGSSVGRFARRLVAEGLLRRRDVARLGLHELLFSAGRLGPAAVERLCSRVVGAAAGQSQREIEALANDEAPVIASSAFAGGAWLLGRHRDAGDRTVLLSAAPQELVTAVARHLGIDEAIGTVAEVCDGRYTGTLAGPFCHGAGKLVRLRSLLSPIDLRRTTAYGDAASDIPLLSVVNVAVAVNPDRVLASAAAAAGWPVLRFA